MTYQERINAHHRAELGIYEERELPSHFWEPQPDEEDLERMRQEQEDNTLIYGNDPLPFE